MRRCDLTLLICFTINFIKILFYEWPKQISRREKTICSIQRRSEIFQKVHWKLEFLCQLLCIVRTRPSYNTSMPISMYIHIWSAQKDNSMLEAHSKGWGRTWGRTIWALFLLVWVGTIAWLYQYYINQTVFQGAQSREKEEESKMVSLTSLTALKNVKGLLRQTKSMMKFDNTVDKELIKHEKRICW